MGTIAHAQDGIIKLIDLGKQRKIKESFEVTYCGGIGPRDKE